MPTWPVKLLLHIDKELEARIKLAAKQRKLPVTSWIRVVLNDYLNEIGIKK